MANFAYTACIYLEISFFAQAGSYGQVFVMALHKFSVNCFTVVQLLLQFTGEISSIVVLLIWVYRTPTASETAICSSVVVSWNTFGRLGIYIWNIIPTVLFVCLCCVAPGNFHSIPVVMLGILEFCAVIMREKRKLKVHLVSSNPQRPKSQTRSKPMRWFFAHQVTI